MRYVEVAGMRLSVVGVGTWQFGSNEWGYGDEYAERGAIEIVHRALDLGVNLVDSAEVYAMGRAERIIGQAITGRRDEAFVATKVFPAAPVAPVVEQRGRASARRLGIDTIDLYQVHWNNPVVPIGTTMEGMRRLQEQGVVRHVGVSNFSLERWRAAERSLGGPVVSNQVQYNLVHRRAESDLLPYAAANDRLVIAYSPLAQGLLSDAYGPERRPTDRARAFNPLFLGENLERAGEMLRALREVARAHDASPAQVALAWVLRQPNLVVIPGARTIAQLESNVAAADLELSDDEVDRLGKAAERFRPVSGPAALARRLAERLSA